MSGGGQAGRRGPLLDRDEFRLISSYWPEYFPDEVMVRCLRSKVLRVNCCAPPRVSHEWLKLHLSGACRPSPSLKLLPHGVNCCRLNRETLELLDT